MNSLRRDNRAGFTLIELLVVIAIIAILAAMLLPVLGKVKQSARIAEAKTEISGLMTAIKAYNSAYSEFPVSKLAMNAANPAPPALTKDFTYGTYDHQGNPLNDRDGVAYNPPIGTTGLLRGNSELVAILMDLETYPNGTPTVNQNHARNPQKRPFLEGIKMATESSGHGVGPNGVYRDPWGNPYIISLDLNYDDKVRDAFYGTDVSQDPANANLGLNGLVKEGTDFIFNGRVMIWSFGPDGKAALNAKANTGVNQDNILSWQP